MSNEKESTLIRLYHTLRDQLQEIAEEGREQLPSLQELIAETREKSAELSELTREEVDEVSRYLHRDLEATGNYLAETGEDLGRWFHMEEALVEDRLKELFTQLADPTRIALERLDADARASQNYLSGEVIGMGQLKCSACEHTLQFNQTSIIPRCPECNGTLFKLS
ncbi:MAG: zinc ribbon-containing protein [Gammaproteobacteria bacterium]|jgi:Zn finger protein HypA/HybF involved in hydrogenase expression|nr:zinc ribbon-containing protein [Gammaproteobacteria bacterium]MBT3489747.1 zinc ribbon-containing protein [Gammaproteobacteria bacterium]MBT3719708.1 zinc ribbon-containing protein [Gammaproteobacteria bacterium]MBT3845482.1 zinc ribbon-containing protein [Gammaproteobacteria bacterium]MBT3892885.1 zinc ribbon-containing protein [Gammaproteobacteria bacterium]